MKYQIFIHITHNQITNKQVIRKAFEELKDGRYLVSIESGKNRTNPQNRYYWGCCLTLVKEGLQDIGYREVRTNEDAHEVLKYLFLKKLIPNEETGEVIEILGTTTKLSTTEFNEYIERIIQWASEYLNIQIPLPNEQLEMNLKPSIID
jgi:hypothetical protein